MYCIYEHTKCGGLQTAIILLWYFSYFICHCQRIFLIQLSFVKGSDMYVKNRVPFVIGKNMLVINGEPNE